MCVDERLHGRTAPVHGEVRERLGGGPGGRRLVEPATHQVRRGQASLVGPARCQEDRSRVEPARQVALPPADQPPAYERGAHRHQLGATQGLGPGLHAGGSLPSSQGGRRGGPAVPQDPSLRSG